MACSTNFTITRPPGSIAPGLNPVHEFGWEVLLNRAGTTFRKLPDADKKVADTRKAIALMLARPSMIKRPVLDLGNGRLVGFNPESYESALRAGRQGGRRQ